jgi:hypothetical protein
VATWLRNEAQAYAAPIVAVTLISALGTVAAPALTGNPLLLVALTPRLPFLLLASHQVPPLLLLVVATARLCVTDVHYFALGRRWGPAATERFQRLRSRWRIPTWRRPSWLPARATAIVAVLIRPVGRHVALAGAGGASPIAVAIADVSGTMAYVVGVVWIGDTIW